MTTGMQSFLLLAAAATVGAGAPARPAIVAFSPGGCGASASSPLVLTAARSGTCQPLPFSAGIPPDRFASFRVQCGVARSADGYSEVVGTGVLQLCSPECRDCVSTPFEQSSCVRDPTQQRGGEGGPAVTVTCTAELEVPVLSTSFAGAQPDGVGTITWCMEGGSAVTTGRSGACLRAPTPLYDEPLFYRADCTTDGGRGALLLCSDGGCGACEGAPPSPPSAW